MRLNIITGAFCLLLSLMTLSALALFLLLFINIGAANSSAPLFAADPPAVGSSGALSADTVSPTTSL